MGPEGNAVPLFRGVALSIPAKKQSSGDVASMIIAGLMTPANVPGPYGTYVSDAGGQVRTCEGGMICRVRFGRALAEMVGPKVVHQEPRRIFGIPTVDDLDWRTFADHRAVTGQPEMVDSEDMVRIRRMV
jgi:hypothetical protein